MNDDDRPFEPRRASRKELKARIAQLEAQLAASTYEVSLEALPHPGATRVPGEVLLVREGQRVQTNLQGLMVNEGSVAFHHVALRWSVRRVG